MDIGALIWSSFVLLIGSFLLIYSFVVLVRSKRWSIVQSDITDSRIEEGKDIETNAIIYMIKISLSYNFSGSTYNHKHVNAVYQSSSRNQASAKLSDYPIGGQITVWCNPKNPTQYMLKGDITNGIVALCAGIIFLGIGLLIVCVGR